MFSAQLCHSFEFSFFVSGPSQLPFSELAVPEHQEQLLQRSSCAERLIVVENLSYTGNPPACWDSSGNA
jgi:hypothetical protein